jgi:hypothetical protein
LFWGAESKKARLLSIKQPGFFLSFFPVYAEKFLRGGGMVASH